jgi:hypothetical protein
MTFTPDIQTDADPDFDSLVASLREGLGDDLRWVASFDATSYDYRMQYIRPDLKTELSTHDFDVVVHRTIALFQRPYVEEVYAHLGPARSLVVEYERATAVHVYLTDTTGLIVKIRAGNEVPLPKFVDDCLAVLYPGEDEA